MIDWLEENKSYAVLILLAYYLLVVLPHEWVGKLTVLVFGQLSRSHYNLLIASITLVIIIVGSVFLFRKLKHGAYSKLWTFYLIANAILVALCFYFLFVVNIEVVHFPQYAVFAILCFPLFKNTVTTLTISTFAGALDELYQYVILTPHTSNYFDFNDVVIDLIGAAIGLLILRIMGFTPNNNKPLNWYKSFSMVFVFCFAFILFILYQFGVVETNLSENSNAIFSFVKIPELSFWSYPPGPPAKFHVLRPLEGCILIVALWLFYLPLNTSKISVQIK